MILPSDRPHLTAASPFHRFVASAVLTGSALIIASSPVAAAKEHPDLSGVWVLNEDVSDDLQEKLAELDQRPGGGAGGGAGGGGFGGAGGVGGVGGVGGGRLGTGIDDRAAGTSMNTDAIRERMEAARAAATQLDVRWDDPVLTVIGARGQTQVLQIDGDQRPTQDLVGQSFPAKAKWKKERLIVTWNRDGTSIRETWQLGARGTQLYITIEVPSDGRARPIELRTVYDRQDGEPEDGSR